MAALQMTVSGTAQDVDNLIVTTTPVSSPTFLQGATFLANNVTSLISTSDPVTSPEFLQIDGGKLFEENINRLVEVSAPKLDIVHIQSGVASPLAPTGGGGSSEPVSKESWE